MSYIHIDLFFSKIMMPVKETDAIFLLLFELIVFTKPPYQVCEHV